MDDFSDAYIFSVRSRSKGWPSDERLAALLCYISIQKVGNLETIFGKPGVFGGEKNGSTEARTGRSEGFSTRTQSCHRRSLNSSPEVENRLFVEDDVS